MSNILKINNLHSNINNILLHLGNNEIYSAYLLWESVSEEEQNYFIELKCYFKKYIFLKESINNKILNATKNFIEDNIQNDINKLNEIEKLISEGKKSQALQLSKSLEYLEVPEDLWNFFVTK